MKKVTALIVFAIASLWFTMTGAVTSIIMADEHPEDEERVLYGGNVLNLIFVFLFAWAARNLTKRDLDTARL